MNCKYMLWRDEITRIKAIVNEPDLYRQAMDELKQTEKIEHFLDFRTVRNLEALCERLKEK